MAGWEDSPAEWAPPPPLWWEPDLPSDPPAAFKGASWISSAAGHSMPLCPSGTLSAGFCGSLTSPRGWELPGGTRACGNEDHSRVFAMPVFDMIETVLIKNFQVPSGICLRLFARSAYVAFTCFIGVTFPFFGDLLGFFGGFAFAPTSYFLPCMMWLALCKPKRFSLTWLVNWACIIFGFLLMLVSTIGGLRSIIIDAYTYEFYQ